MMNFPERPGQLALVLHHHLPYVRHPEYEDFMEEDWLHQAVTETYMPLLDVFERLRAEGVPYRMTVSLTPPLISMLDDPLLRDRTERHMTRLLRLAESELLRNKDDAATCVWPSITATTWAPCATATWASTDGTSSPAIARYRIPATWRSSPAAPRTASCPS